MAENREYLPNVPGQESSKKQLKGYRIEIPEQFRGAEAKLGEYNENDLRDKGIETRGRHISNEQADAQIAKAMEDLKTKITPELFEKVIQAAGKPDGDAFKNQVAQELRLAIGEEAFNQFNADTTVSRPFIPFNKQGASPTTTRSHS